MNGDHNIQSIILSSVQQWRNHGCVCGEGGGGRSRTPPFVVNVTSYIVTFIRILSLFVLHLSYILRTLRLLFKCF